MPSSVLDRAVIRRTQLLEELEKINAFIALYRQFETLEEGGSTAPPEESPISRRRRRLNGTEPKPTRPREILPIIFGFLNHHQKPLPTRAILDYLVIERGVEVSGKNPFNNLSAMLSYDDRFKSTPAGWILTIGHDTDVTTPEKSGAVTETER